LRRALKGVSRQCTYLYCISRSFLSIFHRLSFVLYAWH